MRKPSVGNARARIVAPTPKISSIYRRSALSAVLQETGRLGSLHTACFAAPNRRRSRGTANVDALAFVGLKWIGGSTCRV